jgi:putative two-component system response regulator
MAIESETSRDRNLPLILLVDDQAEIRLTLRRALESESYLCMEANSIRTAMEIIEREPVHLVLCDINLIDESGLDLVRALKPKMPDTSVIMVSAVDDSATAIDCLELGAFGFVLKPFQLRDIRVQVNGALRRRMLEISHRDREKELTRRVREQVQEIRESREELAHRLISASEHRDHETGAHVRRIGLYAAEMARLLNWDVDAIDCILGAAPMHDIGKVGVPDAILQKPGALTEEEWVLMRQHTTMGAEILKGSTVPFIQMGARIAACHHEKWDGSGYPNQLAGESIPVEARITALVDVFDALMNRRHYKDAWSENATLEFMRKGRGAHFDPTLFDVFMEHRDGFMAILKANPDGVASAF